MVKSQLMIFVKKRSHILCWIGYGIYFYAINRLTNDHLTWIQVFGTIPFFAAIFYTVVCVLKRIYRTGKVFLPVLLLCLFYVLLGFAIYILLYGNTGITFVQGQYIIENHDYSGNEFIQSLLVMLGNYSVFAVLYFYISKSLNEMKERYELEKQKKTFEYISLAGQVSPHLMANLFVKWENDFDRGEMRLLDGMKQSYQMMLFYMDANSLEKKTVILLEDELSQLKNYREIFIASSDQPKYITINCKGNCLGKTIPPTTLTTLLENAIKHGVVDDPKNPIRVRLECSAEEIRIECQNKIASKVATRKHGVGLRNLKRRLELCYESSVSFYFHEKIDQYNVLMKIHLKK